ncbi:MAG: tetratricopeptide repeat protein [Porticoccus sp.]|nr:tetratricopeptide repeat protein [Porticoccus sp.]
MFIRTFQIFVIFVSCCVSGIILAAVDPWTESYRLEALSQYDNAANTMSQIIKKYPNNDFAVSRRAWLNYLRGAHNESIRDYEKVLEINSKSLDARIGILLPFLAQRRWREASSNANKALKISPWNYYAHVRLMISEEGEKKWDALAKHAKEVSQRYPSDATVLVYLARANDRMKNTQEARRAYEQVLERVPGHIEATQYLNR